MKSSIALSMPKKKFHDRVQQLFSYADVEINGQRPWDIHIHNDNFYTRILKSGTLGLGESYMDGWWDTDQLDEFICKLLRGDLRNKIKAIDDLILSLQARFANLQNPTRAYEVGEHHYDIGNDLYECMLDKRMIYSCAYWQNASSLDEAQEAKLDLICRKLELQAGMRVLDIGCGWGGTARFAAENYGVEVVGISISKEQVSLAKERCKGLPIEIRLQDYRSLDETFDRILSIGMFEHVGYKNYRTFMKKAHDLLDKNGLFLLHTIGSNRTKRTGDSWMNKYIFPNAMLPSVKQISQAFEGLFVLEDWHNFGPDYDRTLMHWFENFNRNWHLLQDKYGDRFYRMWKFYLLLSAGCFRARHNHVWQIVLSPKGIPGGYKARCK